MKTDAMEYSDVSLAFGARTIGLKIPVANLLTVLQPNPIKIDQDETDLVNAALNAPIQSQRLSQIVKPGEKIVIITSDVTRPMPSRKVLPSVIGELAQAGIKDQDITIVFALGNHREHSEAEKIALVGEMIYNRISCIDSNGKMIQLGKTAMGTPVDIFETVVNADRRICLGNIEYHYFAGYSGGAKAIMPGVSTREAIQANHSRMIDPAAAAGKLEGNPVREDIDSVLNFISIDFIVNVILGEHKQIVHCVAGHPIHAHRQGCKLLDSLFSLRIPQQAEIVIVSPGGYPKDLNLYQAQKALDNAKHAVRKGGSILWIASAAEGLGEKHFEQWMLNHDHPKDMVRHIQAEFVLGGHKAAAIALVTENADVYLYSDLDAEFVRKIHLNPVSDPQEQLNSLLKRYGDGAGVIVMPYGGSTLPVLEKCSQEE